MRKPVFTDTLQVGFVVRDLDASMKMYMDEYGIGPWQVFEFGTGDLDGRSENTVKDDQPATYAMRIAIADVGRVQWELIQPLDEKSNYAEFLAKHGEGVHHLQMAVESYDDAVADLRSRGHSTLIGGTFNGVDLVYLSTDRDLGVITEIVDWPDQAGHEADAGTGT